MFHLLCPGSGDCWRSGLRFCAHSDGVRGQEDCGGSGIVVLDRGPGDRDSVDRDSVVLWNRAVFLFLDFHRRQWHIYQLCCEICGYMRYMLIY